MERYGVSRANMFCLDEPDRHPGFRAANDRTLAFAERSSGRLVPFVRLDLTEEPLEEARRCLDLGARGIKLHPRAQRFQLNDERLSPIFAIAAERNVPILIHGGRGLPPIAARAAPARRVAPRLAADHRPRRDRRPRQPRRVLRGEARRLLRHLGLERGRPARLPAPRPARAGRLRLGLPVRSPAELAPARAPHRADRRLQRGRGPQHARRQRAPDRGRRGAARAVRAARPRDVLQPMVSRGSTSTSRWRRRCSGRASRTRSACSGSR